jgi:hypothetical protein
MFRLLGRHLVRMLGFSRFYTFSPGGVSDYLLLAGHIHILENLKILMAIFPFHYHYSFNYISL